MLCSTIPTLCGATVHVIVTPDNITDKYICYVQPFQHCVAPLFMSLSHPITLQTNICYVQPFQHCVAPLFMSLSHPITLQTNMLCSTIPTLCGATVHVIVTPDNITDKYICYVQPFQYCVAPLSVSLSHPITLQTNIYVMFNHSNTVWRHCSHICTLSIWKPIA